jgi:hypothetical protein
MLALVALALSVARCSLPHAALREEDSASGADSTVTDSTTRADGSDASIVEDARDSATGPDVSDVITSSDASDVVAMDADSGVVMDTGVAMDTGVMMDTGVAMDTGVIADSSAVRDTGVVVDSGTRPVRCADFTDAERASGAHTLYNGMMPWQAYCDFDAPDGPWTLIAKVNPTDNEWRYDAGRWEDMNLLNETVVDLSRSSAKYQGFLSLTFTAARLTFVTDQLNGAADPWAVRTIGFAFNSGTRSMREVLRAGDNQLIMGTMPGQWLGVIPTLPLGAVPLLDSACTRTAFNNVGASGMNGYRARIGIIGDDSMDCRSPGSWIGVGCNPTDGFGATHVAGNRHQPSIIVDDRRTPSFVFIWVR